MKIFGTDGVRGVAGIDITPFLTLKLGIAAGLYFKKSSHANKILVGKDTRKSGYMIENSLVSALTSIGYDVVQVGPMPTPAIAFLTQDLRCDAGVMISASHNSYEDNGIKFFDRNGSKLDIEAEEEIEQIFSNSDLLDISFKTHADIGSSKRVDDVIGRYITHIKSSFRRDFTMQGLRIVIDCANGAAYKVAPTIFKELGADVIVINNSPNGLNINDKCGAIAANELSENVLKYRADIGFALDGDADRLVVVDEKGGIIHGDKLIGALALFQKSLKNLAKNKVAITHMSNLALEDFLKTHGIDTLRCDVGDKFISSVMQKEGLNFGAEQSGHIIFNDFGKTGDGLVSALQVTGLLKYSNKLASEILNPFELYPFVLESIKVKEKRPLDDIKEIVEFKNKLNARKIRHLIRYSGTENKLRILLECKDIKALKSAKEEIGQICIRSL